MKKEAIRRGLLGAPIGVAIGYIITIIISVIIGDGNYAPVVPALTEQFGSEIAAVVLQMLLCAVFGFVAAAASVIWDFEKWNYAKQTGVYFCIMSITVLPIAYLTHWMQRSFLGFVIYFVSFVVLFFIIWLVGYAFWRIKIKQINDKINKS
jgi:hypothetical protein